MLFNGKTITAGTLPWYYIPEWFSITTPVVYLILGVTGIFSVAVHILKNPGRFLSNSPLRNNLLFLACLFTPVLAVIFLHSKPYDAWRHLYFIYPSFVMLAVYGLNVLFKMGMKKPAIVFSFLAFIFTGHFMIKNFPNQNVYFNAFCSFRPPEYLRKTFELDYWGVTYKQSLEFILMQDKDSLVNINVANPPGEYNRMILTSAQRNRIRFVPIEEAKYFVTNYRWHPQDYFEYSAYKFYSIHVLNNTVNEVFKLK
jgi:hypothetical protein